MPNTNPNDEFEVVELIRCDILAKMRYFFTKNISFSSKISHRINSTTRNAPNETIFGLVNVYEHTSMGKIRFLRVWVSVCFFSIGFSGNHPRKMVQNEIFLRYLRDEIFLKSFINHRQNRKSKIWQFFIVGIFIEMRYAKYQLQPCSLHYRINSILIFFNRTARISSQNAWEAATTASNSLNFPKSSQLWGALSPSSKRVMSSDQC